MFPKSIEDLNEPFYSVIMNQIGDDRERYEWLDQYIKEEYERNYKIESKLRRYYGPLNIEEIQQGITLCFENSKDLLDDSIILFDSEKYHRATALSFGAIEEVGKIHILHEMAELPYNANKLWKKKWQDFNDHHYKKALGKQEIWADQLALYGGISLNPISKEMKYLDSYRQDALYVNFSAEENNWISPKGSFDKDSAQTIINMAKDCVERTGQHISNKLYSIESLTIRNDICGLIYSQEIENEINVFLNKLDPQTVEQRATARKKILILKLTEVRKKYFEIIKEKGFVL